MTEEERKKELAKLIKEQEVEMGKEKASVFFPASAKGYKRGRYGIFVGNRVF